MGNLNDFIEFLDTQVKNHSIYVWAAQGQGANIISESWIRKMETSEKNAQRAINFWKKQVAAGLSGLRLQGRSTLRSWQKRQPNSPMSWRLLLLKIR